MARRLVISASEDIGNADPHALQVAVAAFHALQLIGMPEGRITLAQCVTYLACAPRAMPLTRRWRRPWQRLTGRGAGRGAPIFAAHRTGGVPSVSGSGGVG